MGPRVSGREAGGFKLLSSSASNGSIGATSPSSQAFIPRNRVKLESDRQRKEQARDWTMEEVWPSFPSWMKPRTKDEKSLNEGLEKASRNQDNMNRTSCWASWNRIGCSPFRANLKLGGFISLL